MNTDKHGLLCEKATEQGIGSAMEVLNTLGHGLLEKPCENALTEDFIISRGLFLCRIPFCFGIRNPCLSVFISGSICWN